MDQKEFRQLAKAFAGKTIQTTSGRPMTILKLDMHGASNEPNYTAELSSGGHKFKLGTRAGDHYPVTDMNGTPQPGLKIKYQSLYELTHGKG